MKNKVFTIPNILTFIRLGLIPLILYFYLGLQNYVLSGIIVILSAITDLLDGFIARKFNMISKLGMMLDPFADKLTQIALLICLSFTHPLIFVPLGILVFRDVYMFFSGLCIIKKGGEPFSALWYGKIATAFTYANVLAHFFFININEVASIILISFDAVLILLSFVMYLIHNNKILREIKQNKNVNNIDAD